MFIFFNRSNVKVKKFSTNKKTLSQGILMRKMKTLTVISKVMVFKK